MPEIINRTVVTPSIDKDTQPRSLMIISWDQQFSSVRIQISSVRIQIARIPLLGKEQTSNRRGRSLDRRRQAANNLRMPSRILMQRKQRVIFVHSA